MAASASVPQEPLIINEGDEDRVLAELDRQERADAQLITQEIEKNGPQLPSFQPLEPQPEETPFIPQPLAEEETSVAVVPPKIYQRTTITAPQFYSTTLKPPSYVNIIKQAKPINPLATALLFSFHIMQTDQTYRPKEMEIITQKVGIMRSMIQYAMQYSERGKLIHKTTAWNTINVPMRFDDTSEQYAVYNSYTDRLVRMRLQFQRGYIMMSAGLAGMLRYSPFVVSINGTMNVFNYKDATVPRLSNGTLYQLFAPHLIHLMAGGDVPTEPSRIDTFLPSHFVPLSFNDASPESHLSYIVSPLFIWDNGRFYKTCRYDEPNPIQTRVPTTAAPTAPPRKRHVNWHASPKSTTSVACTHNYGAALDMHVTKMHVGMHHIQSALRLALLELDAIHGNEAAVRDMMQWWCKQQEAFLLLPLLATYETAEFLPLVRTIIDGMNTHYGIYTTLAQLQQYGRLLRSIIAGDAHIDEYPGPIMIKTQSDFRRFFGLCVFLCKGDPAGTYVHSSLATSFVDESHAKGVIVSNLHVLTFEQTTTNCIEPYYIRPLVNQNTQRMTPEDYQAWSSKRYDHQRLMINRGRWYTTINQEITHDLASAKELHGDDLVLRRFTDEEFKRELLRIFVKYGESLDPEGARREDERKLAQREQARLQRQQEQLEAQRHAHEEHYQQAVAMWKIRHDQEQAQRKEVRRKVREERQQLLDIHLAKNHEAYEQQRQRVREAIERRVAQEELQEAQIMQRLALEERGGALKRAKPQAPEAPTVELVQTPPTVAAVAGPETPPMTTGEAATARVKRVKSTSPKKRIRRIAKEIGRRVTPKRAREEVPPPTGEQPLPPPPPSLAPEMMSIGTEPAMASSVFEAAPALAAAAPAPAPPAPGEVPSKRQRTFGPAPPPGPAAGGLPAAVQPPTSPKKRSASQRE